jgi:hypothetical protein
MGLENSSQANNGGSPNDSLIMKAAGDLHDGQYNNQAFSRDVQALYTADQGNKAQLNADLAALNQQLEDKNVLPGLSLVGEDAQGDVLYMNSNTDMMAAVDKYNNMFDVGNPQSMLDKYTLLQDQPNAGDQGSSPGPGPAEGPGSEQGPAQGQGGDQGPAQGQGGDQGPTQGQGGDHNQATPPAGDSGQPETWGQNGRQYTPGQDGAYTHVVQEFQGADKPGDDMYRIATDSLDNQHKNDPNYKPTAQEVTAEIQRIAAYNKDAGTIGVPPDYMIKVGDTINIPPKDWTAPGTPDAGKGSGSSSQGAGDTPPVAEVYATPGSDPSGQSDSASDMYTGAQSGQSAGPGNSDPYVYQGVQSGEGSPSDQAPYGYGPPAYAAPPYEYPPVAYEMPAPEPVVVVNPVGIVRDVARLFRR